MWSQYLSVTKFQEIVCKGSHSNIAIKLTFQYLNLIPPVARNTLDCLFVEQINKQIIELLVSELISGNISKEEFINM